MRTWGTGSDRLVASWITTATFLLFLSLIPWLAGELCAWEVEPGYGRVRLWQGIENTGVGFQRFKYLGLGVDLNQPTLNYGNWQFNFVGLGEDWGAKPRLGYGLFGFRNMWLREDLAADFMVGDSYLETGVNRMPFEHFTVPSQNLRGLDTRLYDGKYAMGVHAGNLTYMSFLLTEAFVRSDTDMAGFFLRLGDLQKPRLGLGMDGFTDNLGKRYLSNFHVIVPMEGPEGKGFFWYDSRSSKPAGVVGVRQDKGRTQWEVGASYVPFGFIYLSENASLSSGQSLGFATYRESRLRYNYYLEGSGGQLSFGQEKNALVRGTLGGGWRFSLRDMLGGSLGVSWQGGGEQNNWHLLPSLRYSRVKGAFNLYSQLLTDYYTLKLVNRDGLLVAQPAPLGGAQPETSQTTRIFRWGEEIGFDYSPPGATRWGGSARFDDTHTTGNLATSYRTATAEVRVGKYLPYDTTVDLSVRSGYSWGQNQTSAIHSGGLRLSINAFENWLIFVEGRLWYSKVPQEVTGFASIPNPAYEVRSGGERRLTWGEAAPVHGVFPSTGLRGVGTLTGVVFHDKNGNGLYDAGDIPLKDTVIRLDDGFIVETNSQGRYYYPNVVAGEHSLQLDPESYPVYLTSKFPEGMRCKIFPREKRQIDWPLSGK